jgi:hypothetical protein
MTRIPKATESLLASVFAATSTPDADRDAIIGDLKKHGRIRDTLATWQGVVQRCEGELQGRARFEIGVDDRAAAQLARSAALFREDSAAAAPIIEPVPEAPPHAEVIAAPQSPTIDMAAVNAWLGEIGLAGHEDIADLTDLQLETLARIAQKNRRFALMLITHAPLAMAASPGLLLNNLRAIMASGSHEWTRMMTDRGLFADDPHLIQGSLALLHRSAELAPLAERLGVRIRVRDARNDIRFAALPPRVQAQLSRRLGTFLPRGRSLSDFATSVIADVIVEGDTIVEVMHVGGKRVAFAEPKTVREPEDYIREQLRGYQLLALASQLHIGNVEFAIYGSDAFDERWVRGMEAAAREMGIGFIVTHNSRWTGGSRYLFGSRRGGAREETPRPHTMPPLRMPRRHRMLADSEAPRSKPDAAAIESVEAMPPMSFRQFATLESLKGDHYAAWARAIDMGRNSTRFPRPISSTISELYVGQHTPVDAMKELERIGRLVWDEIEGIFGELDETAADFDSFEAELGDGTVPDGIPELTKALEGLATTERRLSQLHTEFERLEELWQMTSDLARLIHPDHWDAFLGTTPDGVFDAFGETYIPLDGRLRGLDARLAAYRAALEGRLLSARVSAASAEARKAIDDATRSAGDAESKVARGRAAIAARQKAPIDTSTAGWRQEFFAVVAEALRPQAQISIPTANQASLRQSLEALESIARQIPGDDPRQGEIAAKIEEVKSAQGVLQRAQASVTGFQEEHDAYVRRLKEVVQRAEDGMDIPNETPLPPVEELNFALERTIEGRGHVHFNIDSRTPRARRGLHEMVIRRFRGARAVVYDGKVYLIDTKTASELARWRQTREHEFRCTDLLSEAVSLPAYALGVRLAEVAELTPDHPYRRLVTLFAAYVTQLPIWARDFVTTVASHTDTPDGREVWRRVAALALKMISDEEMDIKPGDTISPLATFKINEIALSLLEEIERSPTLSTYASQWFSWGETSRALHGEFTPLPEDILGRLGQMSEDDMTVAIEGTGLIPPNPSDRQTWIDEWRRYARECYRIAKHGCRSRDAIRMANEQLRRLDTLPMPYVLARAIAHRADRETILERRFELFETQLVRDSRQAGDDRLTLTRRQRCEFAIRFLVEHQGVIGRWLRRSEQMEDEAQFLNSLSESPEEAYAVMSRRLESQGHDVGRLAGLGMAYLLTLSADMTAEVPPVIYLMMGRVVDHRDDMLISRFARLVRETWTHMRRSGDELVDDDGNPMTPNARAQTFIDCVAVSWDDYEDAMSLRPADSQNADAFLATRGRRENKGGGGGSSGSGGAAGGGGPASPPPSPQGGQATASRISVPISALAPPSIPITLRCVTMPWQMGGTIYTGLPTAILPGFISTGANGMLANLGTGIGMHAMA